MTANLCNNENYSQSAHRRCTTIICPEPAARSFYMDNRQRRRKSWSRAPFSSSCSSLPLPDADLPSVSVLTSPNCPAWLLPIACKGPHFRSIDQRGCLTDGGAYERLGKSARASLQ
eukprot:766442-Hanusia_phi.AAC.8